MHQTQGVPHRLRVQHTLTRDWTDAAVSQGGCHDTGALAGHLNRTQLEVHTRDSLYHFSITIVFRSAQQYSTVKNSGGTGDKKSDNLNKELQLPFRAQGVNEWFNENYVNHVICPSEQTVSICSILLIDTHLPPICK